MRTFLPSACNLLALSLVICVFNANGQEFDSSNEFWPEINVFIRLNDNSRIFAMGTATRQENLGTYADGQAGIYFDFWALPPFRGRLIGHADSSRSKLLLLRTGYLFSRPKNNSGAATEHTLTSEATGRFHLPVSLLLSDRSRIDLRWVNGDLRWRYRNRLKIERTFRVKRFEWTPYSHAEAFYSLDQSTWNRLRYAVGTELALSRRIVLEGYFLRQNDWGSVPTFVNAIGIALQLYLR